MYENKELIERARAFVTNLLKVKDPKAQAFDETLRNKIRNDVGEYLFTATKRRPMVLPVIIEV